MVSPQIFRDIEQHILSEYPEITFKQVTASNDVKKISLSVVCTSFSQDRAATLTRQVSLLSGVPCEISCLLADTNTLQSGHLTQLLPLLTSREDVLSITLRKGVLLLTFAGAVSPDTLSLVEDEIQRNQVDLKVEGAISAEAPLRACALSSYRIVNGFNLRENLISALPSEDIASLFTHTLLPTSLSEQERGIPVKILNILEEELPKNKFALTRCGAVLLLTFDSSLLKAKSEDLYNALHRIYASVPYSYPLVVSQVPFFTPSLTAMEDEPNGIAAPLFRPSSEINSPDLVISCGRYGYNTLYQNALSRLGTKESWYFIEDTKEKTLLFFTDQEDRDRIKQFAQIGEQLAQDRGYLFSLNKLSLSSFESLHTSPTRDSISVREWRDIIKYSNKACTGKIKDSPIRSVYSLGNIIVIETDFTLPDACQQGILRLLRMVPAPIMFKAKSVVAPKLSLQGIKSIVKLGLPIGATLQSGVGEREQFPPQYPDNGRTLFSIIGHLKDKAYIHTMCGQLQEVLKDQQLFFTVECYKKDVTSKIRLYPTRLNRFLLSGINPRGEIDLQNTGRSVPKKRASSDIDSRKEEGWIRALSSSHKDATNLFCWTYDPKGASLKEDALSVTLTSQDSFTLTVHLSNVALTCPPFSAERHSAYRLGESLYDSSRNVIPMLPHSRLFSLNVGAVRPVISVSWHFAQDKDYVWDLIQPTPDISHDLISVKAALSPDDRGETIAVEGRLPSKREQFCAEIAAKVLMTGRLIQSSDGFAQWAVNQQQQHFLGHANLALGNYLRSSNLPLIYQRLERPTLKEFAAFCRKLSQNEFRKLSPLGFQEIYSNDDYLRRFIMRVKDYYRFTKKGNRISLSVLGQPTLQPEYNFIYGEEGIALFNAPARRALSLVNTHQFSAYHGLVEPMSFSEVKEAFCMHQQAAVVSSQKNSTITLARQLEHLRNRKNSRLSAVVTEIRPGKVGLDAILFIQKSNFSLTGVIENVIDENSISKLLKLTKGSQLYVTPSRYSHIEDRFYFSIAPEQ